MSGRRFRAWYRASLVLGLLVASAGSAAANGTASAEHKASKPDEVQAGVKAYKNKEYARAHTLLFPWAQKGDPSAQYHLGRMYEKGEGRNADKEQAIKWYKASAEGGYARAQYKVAAGYLSGYGSMVKDEPKAREWLVKSAEGGYRRAQRILAEAYRRGEIGFPVDATKAAYWAKKAER